MYVVFGGGGGFTSFACTINPIKDEILVNSFYSKDHSVHSVLGQTVLTVDFQPQDSVINTDTHLNFSPFLQAKTTTMMKNEAYNVPQLKIKTFSSIIPHYNLQLEMSKFHVPTTEILLSLLEDPRRQQEQTRRCMVFNTGNLFLR